MKRAWQKLITVLVIMSPACGYDVGADLASVDDGDVGTLRLSLTGQDAEMQQYRLRDATFDIVGTRYTDFQSVSTSAFSEEGVDEPTLSTQLFFGYYYVSLRPSDWYIERMTEQGPERVEQAALLTQGPQSAAIQTGQVSPVAFQFGVDGELIDFLGGELEIGVSFQRAPGSEPESDAGADVPEPGASCVGFCGQNAGTCWCDSACIQAGDCCADKIAICGE